MSWKSKASFTSFQGVHLYSVLSLPFRLVLLVRQQDIERNMKYYNENKLLDKLGKGGSTASTILKIKGSKPAPGRGG
jgi:hypothetical protein